MTHINDSLITRLQSVADGIMKRPGQVKGVAFLTDRDYFLRKYGQDGIGLLEELLEKLGYPLRYKDIKSFEWYPEALSVLSIVVAKELFEWTEQDVYDMGFDAPNVSLFVKTVMRLISVETSYKQVPMLWSKYYDFSTAEAVELNKDEKYVVLRFKDYDFHPIMQTYLCGYLTKMAMLTIAGTNPRAKARQCDPPGAACFEVIVHWD